MSGSVAFGRYWPGTSPVHHMDARAKLLGVLAYVAIVFCAQSFAALAVCAVFTAAFYACARIPVGTALKAVAPLLFIVAVTVVLNLLFVYEGTPLVSWWVVTITDQGVRSAAFFGARLVLLLFGVCLLTLTTATLDLTDAFESLLRPLARLGVPVHELAMMMGIALRFLPQFAAELGILRRAQASRGAKLATRPFAGGLAGLRSLVVPLFASAFRHAETLSAAMDARCYHGGPGRTRLHPLAYSLRDAAGAAALAAMLAAVVAANIVWP